MTRYRLTTKDLVTVALLSALGGALSTYIGYLGNLVNHIMGVPFGAGQFLAGLHVLWIVLAVGITGKKGVGTTTGLLKGTVEFFLGSTHGVIIIAVSLVQGILVDTFLFTDRAKKSRSVIIYGLAGAVAAASNVIVFQSVFFSGVPWIMILMLCLLAAASGVIFAGWLPIEMLATLERAGIVEGKNGIVVDDLGRAVRPASDRKLPRGAVVSMVMVIAFLAVFTVGAVYYFFAIYRLPGQTSIDVEGSVAVPFDFAYGDFEGNETTISAELNGAVTHIAMKNYTGIPLRDVLERASPNATATRVDVIGGDGYSAPFSLSSVMADPELLIIVENGNYRLVAANYDGAYWVEEIVTIEVR